MTEWPSYRLEDVVTRVAMGPFGSSIKVSTYVESGVPVINGQQLKTGKVSDAGFNFITEAHADKLKKANAGPGNIVVTHRGTLGQVAMVPRDCRFPRYVVSQSQFLIECDETKLMPEFLTYFLRSPRGQYLLLANANQTGVPSIAQPVTYIRGIEVAVPPLPEQRAIAEVLGALDDKIESNRRVGWLLESWMRREFEARFNVEPGTGSVSIPKLLDVNPKRSLKKSEAAPYLGMSSMPTQSALATEWELKAAGSGQRFINGDVLMARITPCLENGKIALVDFLEDDQVGWGSTEYIVFRSKDPMPLEWAYCLARSDPFTGYAVRHMNGSSGRQRCPASAFDEYKIESPDPVSVKEFGEMAMPAFKRMSAARDENRSLAQLRDTLLPALLSGRIRIPAAAELVEAS